VTTGITQFGKRWKQVLLQAYTDTDNNGNPLVDSYGQPIKDWVTQQNCWVQIKPITSKEEVNAMQLRLDTTHVFYLRYWGNSVSSQNRFLMGTRIFNITGYRNINEDNWCYEVSCKEVNHG
jgi:SPP1 family predicted phage head-tail adaptor